jgi:4-nitrophenyl phosphatase
MKYSTIEGVVLDMDGVLWRGNQPLDGLQELFEWLDERAIPYALATNNSGKTPEDYVNKLAGMGVMGVPAERIVTSGTATAAYLQARYPAGTPVYVFGMDGLRQVLDSAGFDVYGESPQAVVVGVNFDLTYDTLTQATLHIRNGAEFVGTNPDKTFPSPLGLVPGAGSLVAALQASTDVEPVIIGKPAVPMFETALNITQTAPEATLMIGDRLNTDISGAQAVGMQTALVFTGVTTSEELSHPDNDIWPDVAYEGLPELLKAWAGDKWFRDRLKAKKGRV